jgi:hypothetical protein
LSIIPNFFRYRLKQNRLDNQPLKSVLGVLEAVKKFERSGNINTPALDESRPDELLEYLGNRLEEVESESIDINPKAIKKILKKLKNLVRSYP